MKKAFLFVALLLMVCTMANAQTYVNVELKDGTIRSYSEEATSKVTFGEKKGADPTVSEQTINVGDYKATVKLADDTPASEVVFSTNLEGNTVKIKAVSVGGYGLECIKDNEALTPIAANGF